MATTFHRRPLPPPAIEFSSSEGQRIFTEALVQGTMGCFFRLIEQFHTQDEPAFCGLGTLTMVLNALDVDPRKTWKGPWRWYKEELLDCCEDLELIKERGMVWESFLCLARCNNTFVEAHRVDEDGDLETFRRCVEAVTRPVAVCSSEESSTRLKALVVSYSRKQFGQTGDGHYSPIGGYHSASDQVLILDVARFKHPPHWVPLAELHASMSLVDADTGRSRGFILLSAKPEHCTWLSLVFKSSKLVAVSSCCSGDVRVHFSEFQAIGQAFKEAVASALLDVDRGDSCEAAAAAVLRKVVQFCCTGLPLTVVCHDSAPCEDNHCAHNAMDRSKSESAARSKILGILLETVAAFDVRCSGDGDGGWSVFDTDDAEVGGEANPGLAARGKQGAALSLATVLTLPLPMWEAALCEPDAPVSGRAAWSVLQPLLLIENLPEDLRLEVDKLRSEFSEMMTPVSSHHEHSQ